MYIKKEEKYNYTYNEVTRQHTFQQKIKRQKRKYIIHYEIVEVQKTRLRI